jgi:hypothetical protein
MLTKFVSLFVRMNNSILTTVDRPLNGHGYKYDLEPLTATKTLNYHNHHFSFEIL